MPWWLALLIQFMVKYGPSIALKAFPKLAEKIKSLPQEIKDLIAELVKELEDAPKEERKNIRRKYSKKCTGVGCPIDPQST